MNINLYYILLECKEVFLQFDLSQIDRLVIKKYLLSVENSILSQVLVAIAQFRNTCKVFSSWNSQWWQIRLIFIPLMHHTHSKDPIVITQSNEVLYSLDSFTFPYPFLWVRLMIQMLFLFCLILLNTLATIGVLLGEPIQNFLSKYPTIALIGRLYLLYASWFG